MIDGRLVYTCSDISILYIWWYLSSEKFISLYPNKAFIHVFLIDLFSIILLLEKYYYI